MSKVPIDSLEIEIGKALKEYTAEVEQELEKSKLKVAKKTVKTLKKTSPKKTGDYAKGWGHAKRGTNRIVFNRTKPSLTHLLEKGHAKVNGGRVAGISHIKPAEEQAIADFEEEVKRAVGRL